MSSTTISKAANSSDPSNRRSLEYFQNALSFVFLSFTKKDWLDLSNYIMCVFLTYSSPWSPWKQRMLMLDVFLSCPFLGSRSLKVRVADLNAILPCWRWRIWTWQIVVVLIIIIRQNFHQKYRILLCEPDELDASLIWFPSSLVHNVQTPHQDPINSLGIFLNIY